MRFRSATAEDADFLVDMLVLAVNWQPERHLTRAQVLADPTLARYIEGWPRPGDLGVVAEYRRKRVGAAWIRFFSADRPGYGYVADETPELNIAVVAQWRGQGVGRALLGEITSRAKSADIGAISLSVERANFAHHLYLSDGYKIVKSEPAADTMLKNLHPH